LWSEVQAVPLRVLYFCLFNGIQLWPFSLFTVSSTCLQNWVLFLRYHSKSYVTFLSLCMLVNFCLPLLNLKRLLAVNKTTFCGRFGVLTAMMMKISLL
jgi:hypothetical protein